MTIRWRLFWLAIGALLVWSEVKAVDQVWQWMVHQGPQGS